MTNKNKRSVAHTKKQKEPADDAAASAPSTERPSRAMTPFTTAQLAAMMCVAIGTAKLMEFAAALKEGTENPTTCLSYLEDETTCKHSSFGSLVLVKYYSGLSLTAIVLSLMWNLWNTEHLLLKFMTCIFATPLATTTLAAVFSDGIVKSAQIRHLILMSGVLIATCVPSTPEHFPFLNERSWTARSLQSLCLISLATLSLADITGVLVGDAGMQNALLDLGAPLPDAARSVVFFWIVDKLSMALLFAFSVVHLPQHTQRVSFELS
jgi:hypothetical protein